MTDISKEAVEAVALKLDQQTAIGPASMLRALAARVGELEAERDTLQAQVNLLSISTDELAERKRLITTARNDALDEVKMIVRFEIATTDEWSKVHTVVEEIDSQIEDLKTKEQDT